MLVGDASIQIHGVDTGPSHEGDVGAGIILHTNRGDVQGILHRAATSEVAVVWVWGAHGGFAGPAEGIYPVLSEELCHQGITSLRVNYRDPRIFLECILDTLGGVTFLEGLGHQRIVLVGHSLGGAVVIAAAPFSPQVTAVVALSSQTYGADHVAQVSPRPLLLVHGEADRRLPVSCSHAIFSWARDPKKVVVFPEAGHGLRECRDELHTLLAEWIPAQAGLSPPSTPLRTGFG